MGRNKDCPNCGGIDIEYDAARGDSVCADCGTVLEENNVVTEVTFQEDARGRAFVVGQHVRADGKTNLFSNIPGFTREAAEVTLANGRQRIWTLVGNLKLTSHHGEAAMRLFRLGVERNFNRGRRLGNVCSACLYAICRLEKTSHMLLDFSDAVSANVFTLGNTFMKLCRLIHINVPIIDPSLYIHRFASRLQLGEKTHTIAICALRLVARMKRDWMHQGRRPNSICGAALLIACRMHGFERSRMDVLMVVRIGTFALGKRLEELRETTTAGMNREQLDLLGGDDGKVESLKDQDVIGRDPPAYLESLRIRRKKQEQEQQQQEQQQQEQQQEQQQQEQQQQQALVEKSGLEKATPQIEDLGSGVDGSSLDADSIVGQKEMDKHVDNIENIIGKMNEKEIRDLDQAVSKNGDEKGEYDESTLSDIDDMEIMEYINTEEETRMKDKWWHEVNKDYIQEQYLLEKLRSENFEEYKKVRPWKIRKAEKKGRESFENANDIANHVLKKRSKKINYAALLGEDAGPTPAKTIGDDQ